MRDGATSILLPPDDYRVCGSPRVRGFASGKDEVTYRQPNCEHLDPQITDDVPNLFPFYTGNTFRSVRAHHFKDPQNLPQIIGLT